MGGILGIGCTHGPQLQFPDENMADILRRYLRNERTPVARKDPSTWPAAMRAGWADDEGRIAVPDSGCCSASRPRARWFVAARTASGRVTQPTSRAALAGAARSCSSGEGIRALVGVPIEDQADQVVRILYGALRAVSGVSNRGRLMLVEFARSLGPMVASPTGGRRSRRRSGGDEVT
jgi:hypothetical protein